MGIGTSKVEPVVKRVVCLANSRSISGKFVAGLEWDGAHVGDWIRPLNGRSDKELTDSEIRYENGSFPQLLDIIDIPLVKPHPRSHQVENWLIKPYLYWTQRGWYAFSGLQRLLRPDEPLWLDGNHTNLGLNDKILEEYAFRVNGSIRLIKVNQITFRVIQPDLSFGDKTFKVQGLFHYAGIDYRLRVTDTVFEQKCLEERTSLLSLRDVYLTVRLTMPSKGFFTKLIAAVITEDDDRGSRAVRRT